MAFAIGTFVGGALMGLIPGIWAQKKGHKVLGIVSVVLCGLASLILTRMSGLVFLVLLIIVACSKNLTKTEQGGDSNSYSQ